MDEEFRKIMLPMIRRIAPALIAQDMLGVQPMAYPTKLSYTTGADYSIENPFEIEWHWVQTRSPFIFSLKFGKKPPLTDMEDWCNEAFGADQTTWKTHLSKYYFKEEEMRTMFILRWSNEL